MCVYVCVCVRERERERDLGSGRGPSFPPHPPKLCLMDLGKEEKGKEGIPLAGATEQPRAQGSPHTARHSRGHKSCHQPGALWKVLRLLRSSFLGLQLDGGEAHGVPGPGPALGKVSWGSGGQWQAQWSQAGCPLPENSYVCVRALPMCMHTRACKHMGSLGPLPPPPVCSRGPTSLGRRFLTSLPR